MASQIHTVSQIHMVRLTRMVSPLRTLPTSSLVSLSQPGRRDMGRTLTASRCRVHLVMVLILLLPRLLECRLPGGSRLHRRRAAQLVG